MLKLLDRIACASQLGEGIQWHAPSQSLWWADIQGKMLWRWSEAQGTRVYPMPERLCAFAFTGEENQLIAAFESGFALHDLEDGEVDWIARPEQGETGRRFNDGRCDRQGRFWVGTMVEDEELAGADSASLYCLDLKGNVTPHFGGVAISNGACWSPDGGTFYFADSPKREIHAFDFDGAQGVLSNRRYFATTPEGAYPDGANVDAEGCIWNAWWGAGKVARYTPDGQIDLLLDVPASQPTCVAFGGANLDLLCVSSAHDGLDAQAREKDPHAGDIFIYQLDVPGLEEMRYEGVLQGHNNKG